MHPPPVQPPAAGAGGFGVGGVDSGGGGGRERGGKAAGYVCIYIYIILGGLFVTCRLSGARELHCNLVGFFGGEMCENLTCR